MKKRLGTVLLMSLLVVAITACSTNQTAEEPEQSFIAVEIEILQRSQLYIENNFTGRVNPGNDAYVLPTFIAKVEEVYVSVGDLVKKDDALFKLDNSNIQNQVDQANAAYQAALANLAMTTEQINAAKDALIRTKSLYEAGVVSKAQYDQAELAASEKPLNTIAKGVEQARLAYRQAVDALDNTLIKAPIEGTVTSVDVKEGQIALNSQPAIVIMDLDQMTVKINVTEGIVNNLFVGQSVELKIDSADIEMKAEIISIGNTVDPLTNLFNVEISLENNGFLKAGMFAQVTINTDIREDRLSVPGNAVLEKSGVSIVYVEVDGIAHEKNITTGLDTGQRVEIISGLEEGQRIIIKGQNYISDGSIVKVVRGE
ncbi:MAG: efflux RND transporter periplasmic adaptor subunit [Eubacteriales bacterium]|nr:efflux RND transporter periplasmic adaptor subunit [Eubacteriales bacterium]